MIADRTRGRSVIVRHRNPDTLARIETRINDHHPYCFVQKKDLSRMPFKAIRREDGYEGVYGEDLVKLTFGDTDEPHQLKKQVQTWEANIPWVNRVLADRVNPFPYYQYRKWYLDMEWKTESGEITIISVWDSYEEAMFTWAISDELPAGKHGSLGCKKHPEGHQFIEMYPVLLAFDNERDMIKHFVNHMSRCDPDMLIGWYLQGADISQLAKRMKVVGLDPRTLSPLKKHVYSYGDWDQPIPGRLCFDLMVGFERLWVLKHGQLASKKLDDVAWEALKERKTELPDGHDTYYTDFATYVDYNRQDVRLMPKLDEYLNASEHYITLSFLTQIRFRDTPHITKMATQLFLRDPDFKQRIPSKPQFGKVDYEGADIQEPEPGVYRHIGIMDIKAMYHSNAALHNISWDTLSKDGDDIGNGTRFSKENKGLLVRTMDRLTDLRNEYKAKMKSDPDNKHRWDAMQHATKTLVASLYGVCGDSRYGLYHPEIAAAITFTSRQTLFLLRDLCEARGHKVRYGHTDSVMVDVATPDAGVQLCADLNEDMAPIVVEFEKWCDSFFINAKNRYAARVLWTDGAFHDPQTYVKGIELIQARMPPVMKKSMKTTLDAILEGEKQSLVDDRLCQLIENVLGGDLDPSEVLMKGKLKKNLDKYETLSGPSAAAAWANRHLGKGYKEGDFFKVAISDQGDYIAFDDPKEIEGIAEIGWRIMVERFVVKKVEPLYSVVGWSMQPIINAMNGVSDTQWL